MNFPKTKKRDLVGHLVGVPLSPEELLVGRVLWQSRHWKNVILLELTDARVPWCQEEAVRGRPIATCFTGAQVIRQGFWKLFQAEPVALDPGAIAYVSAGSCWVGDERQAEGSPQGLPELRVLGMDVVESLARHALGEDPDPGRLVVRVQQEMAGLVARL